LTAAEPASGFARLQILAVGSASPITMNKLTIQDLDLQGKRVFIRVDFNVPLKDAMVTDDTRIRETLPTLRLAIQKGARLVLASHLGRPKGGPDPKYSLRPAAKKVEELLGKPVAFALDCIGPGADGQSKALRDGEVLVLENVRFHPEEEKNDEAFSKQLAALCDGVFVCDAFGSAHRAHSSVVGITRFVQQAAAGLLMEKELAYLGKAITNPSRPFVAILGGAKVSDKIEVVENLMKIADAMLIGGGMAYTFLKADDQPIGKSLVEEDKVDLARRLRGEAQQKKFALLLPVDHVVGAEFRADTATKTVAVSATPDGWMGLDIGPKTIETYKQKVAAAKTIVWNGPMGVFEMPAFAKGTLEIAKAVAEATTGGATSIVGGGDSVAAVHQSGVANKISHISTGGGASLEFLGGRKLPGVEALTNK
jgi:phosphoglycerate kinase